MNDIIERELNVDMNDNQKRSEQGASLVEYALLVALIAVVCISAISLLGTSASAKFSSIGSEIAAAG